MSENGSRSAPTSDSFTITSVEPQKKDPSRVSVYVDGEFAFGDRKRLHDQLVRRGFDYGLIREVVGLVTEEGDSLER